MAVEFFLIKPENPFAVRIIQPVSGFHDNHRPKLIGLSTVLVVWRFLFQIRQRGGRKEGIFYFSNA
jgi:hypothetical protein